MALNGVEARDAAKYPTMYTSKNYPTQNVSGSEVRNPGLING